MSGSLLFEGVDFSFIFFLGGGGAAGGGGGLFCFGNLMGQILFKFSFFTFFLNVFSTFFQFFFVLRWTLIFVQQSLIHSYNFFRVLWGSVSVGRCAFFVLGHRHLAH